MKRSPFKTEMSDRAVKQNPAANFFLSLFIFVFLLGLAEGALHFIYPTEVKPAKPKGWAIIPEESWIEYHPVLGWFHQKNKSSKLDKNELQIPLTTNSLGLRGTRDYIKAKPAGIRRMYALGDSFTFGFGVTDADVYPRQMEILDPETEVLNLGVAGYGVDQIYLFLKEFGFSYAPDIVFIAVYPEDFWRATRAFNDAGFGKPYFFIDQKGTLTLKHSPVPKEKNFSVPQFPVFQDPAPMDKLFAWSRIYTLGKKTSVLIQKKLGQADPESSPEWYLGQKILSQTVELVRSNNAVPVLVIVPPRRWITGTSEPIQESMLRFAEREGMRSVDLTPIFKEAAARTSVDDYYIPDDYHWTAKGNRLVAETLLKEAAEIYAD